MATNSQSSQRQGPDLDISNVIAAFSEDQVENITGLTKRQLRYWAKTDFFRPSYVEDNTRLPYSRFYSFRDLVALRTIEVLRVQRKVPLQQLRLVAERLSYLGADLWSKTTLYVVDRCVIFVDPTTGASEEVISGQYLLKLPLEQVIRDTRNVIVAMRKRSPHLVGKVRHSRGILRNAWAIAGTRIPVDAVKRLHEDGYSVEEIIDEYPDLTPDDVEGALKHDGSKVA